MMKQEFEALACYEVSQEDYDKIIEPMYMATSLTKAEFVKCIDRKRFALKPRWKVEKNICSLAESLKGTCTHFTDIETEAEFLKEVESYINRFYPGCRYHIYHGILFSCYYPESVEIYDTKTFHTVHELKLA